MREWKAANRERLAACKKAYMEANPLRYEAWRADHRAKKLGANGTVSAEQRATVLAAYQGKCAYCAATEAITFDHAIPLRRGGEHSMENLQPCCQHCNASKADYTVLEWFLMSTISNGQKWCIGCGDVKPLAAFYDNLTAKLGVHARCRSCHAIQAKHRYRSKCAA